MGCMACQAPLSMGHASEQSLGDSGGQRSLVCCSPWGHRESDMTARLNSNESNIRAWDERDW